MPAVSFQLSHAELCLIRTCLARINNAHRLWQVTGKLPHADPRAVFHEAGFDTGVYGTEQMAVVQTSLTKLEAVSGGGAVELSAFEIAACVLGMRVTNSRLRHGHIKPWRADYKAACRQLEKKLEILRKRAKRRFVTANGQAPFAQASSRWRRFVRWVRVYLLYCRCNRTKFPGLTRIRRMRVAERVRHFLGVLPDRLRHIGRAVPAEPELRQLIKQALRSVRRLERRRNQRGLGVSPEERERYVWIYVSQRCGFAPTSPWDRLQAAMGR